MRPIVFVTRKIPDEGMKILNEDFDVRVYDDDNRPVTRADLLEQVKDASAVLSMLNDKINREVLDAAPDLKVVANMAVGTDNIDIDACTEKGIVVANTPGVLTEATADLTFALLLSISRRIVEGDAYVREGQFSGWDPLLFLGGELYNKTLGIIGMGRIGQAVARRAKGFGMNIIYHNRSPVKGEISQQLEAVYLSVDEVVQQADYLTLHLPYYPQVYHIINRERLHMMKPTSYLINTARGAHVDEYSLVDCLKNGKIAGAALDVFEKEPQLTPGLEKLNNVVLAPHVGSAGRETRSTMSRMAAESIRDVLQGKTPEYIVNTQVLES